MSIRRKRSPDSWYCFNHANEGELPINMSNISMETIARTQTVKTDLSQKEGSYWSLKIICAPSNFVSAYRFYQWRGFSRPLDLFVTLPLLGSLIVLSA
jgi:hypothetical protein